MATNLTVYANVTYTQLDLYDGNVPAPGEYVLPTIKSSTGPFNDAGIIDESTGMPVGQSVGDFRIDYAGDRGYIFGRPSSSMVGKTYLIVFQTGSGSSLNLYEVEVTVQANSNAYATVRYIIGIGQGTQYSTYSFVKNCVTRIPYRLWNGVGYYSTYTDAQAYPTYISNGIYYKFAQWYCNDVERTTWEDEYIIVNVDHDLEWNTYFDVWVFHVITQTITTSGGTTTSSVIGVESGNTYTFNATQSKGVSSMTHYTYGDSWRMNWDNHSSLNISDTNTGYTFTLDVGDVVFVPNIIGNLYDTSFDSNGGSAVATITDTQYPNKITLPTSTKQYNTLLGWKINGVTYPAGTQYQPVGDDTLVAQWEGTDYTVNYVQADGTTITRTITYPDDDTNVRPTPTSHSPYFTFVGWDYNGTLYDSSTPFQPTADSTLYARYSFTRTLDKNGGTWSGSGQEPTSISGLYQANQIPSISLPTTYTKSGYSFVGWKPSNGSMAYENNVYIPALTDDFTQLTALWTDVPLRSLTLKDASGQHTLTQLVLSYCDTPIAGYDTQSVVNVALDPEDWGGTYVDWAIDVPGDRGSFFTITQGTRNGDKIPYTFSILQQSDTVYDIYATYGGIDSNHISLILEYVYVVTFVVKETQDDPTTSIAKRTVIDGSPATVWVTGIPEPPRIEGYVFQYWVDDLGNIVDNDHVPSHTTLCTAIYSKIYFEDKSNHLIIQRFNSEGDAIVMQMDVNVTLTFTDSFSPSITDLATPTMTSVNTFITDMAVIESMRFDFVRKTPTVVDDDSADMGKWSNRQWIMALRSLVDRWQSDTDGIRIIFLPMNLHRIQSVKENVTIDGQTVEVETIPMAGELVGLDYDFIGYENTYDENTQKWKFGENVGYLYDIGEEDPILLVGENCLISDYHDDFDPKQVTAISGSIGLTVGGLTSNLKGND